MTGFFHFGSEHICRTPSQNSPCWMGFQLSYNNYGIKVRHFYACSPITITACQYWHSLSPRRRRSQHFSFPDLPESTSPFQRLTSLKLIKPNLINTRLPNRFGSSQLHQRDPRNALFENYNGGANNNRTASSSPRPGGYGGGYGYTGGVNGSAGLGAGLGEKPSYRPATPNSRYDGHFVGKALGRNEGGLADSGMDLGVNIVMPF